MIFAESELINERFSKKLYSFFALIIASSISLKRILLCSHATTSWPSFKKIIVSINEPAVASKIFNPALFLQIAFLIKEKPQFLDFDKRGRAVMNPIIVIIFSFS